MSSQTTPRHARLLAEIAASRATGRARPSDTLIRAIAHEAARIADPTRTQPDLDTDAAAIFKAATAPGSSGGWGAPATTTAVADFVGGLTSISAAASLFARALNFELGRTRQTFVPGVATGATAAWTSELTPIPVTSGVFGRAVLEPRKIAAIAVLTREMLRGSNAETAVRALLGEAVARGLDATAFDAVAADSERPAGLLNDVTAVTGTAGGDVEALRVDLNALVLALTPVSAGGVVLVVSPSRALRLSLLAPDLALPVLASAGVAETSVIAIAPAALAVALGGVEIDVETEGVLHMSDDPAEIVAAGEAAADPTRELWQTDCVAVRVILSASWARRGPGVAWISGASW